MTARSRTSPERSAVARGLRIGGAQGELREDCRRHPIIYLYHALIIIAHTAKLQGYTQLPDGLVRVVGVSLEP